MKLEKLHIYTIIWILLVLFSPIRPNPMEQVENASSYYIQLIIMVAPYIALSLLILKMRFNWIRRSWIENTAPFILLLLIGLDAYNCLVANISGMGSFLTAGIAYLIVLNVAHNNENYFDGLMFGIIAGIASLFVWEAIYQIIIYTKADWQIWDNITYFYSAIVTIPFIATVILRKVKLTRMALICLSIFGVTMLAWALSGFWTYVIFKDGVVTTESYSYIGYTLTRSTKLALGAVFALLTYRR